MLLGEVAVNLPGLKVQLRVERGLGGEKRKGAVFYLMSVAAPSPQCLAHGEYSETGPSTKTDGKLHPEFSLSRGRAPLDCSHQSPCLCTSRGT